MNLVIVKIMAANRVHWKFLYAEPVSSVDEIPGSDITELYSPYTQSASFPNHLQDDVINRILSFSELNNDWDGDGAVPPSSDVIDNSTSFYRSIPEFIAKRVNPGDIYPSPYGTIFMEWQLADKRITVEVGKLKIGYRAKNLGDKLLPLGINFSTEIPLAWLRAFRDMYPTKHEWSSV